MPKDHWKDRRPRPEAERGDDDETGENWLIEAERRARQSDAAKAKREAWKRAKRAEKRMADRERQHRLIKESQQAARKRRGATTIWCYITCRECGRRYTSVKPPPRNGGRMQCRCGGGVRLEHQL